MSVDVQPEPLNDPNEEFFGVILTKKDTQEEIIGISSEKTKSKNMYRQRVAVERERLTREMQEQDIRREAMRQVRMERSNQGLETLDAHLANANNSNNSSSAAMSSNNARRDTLRQQAAPGPVLDLIGEGIGKSSTESEHTDEDDGFLVRGEKYGGSSSSSSSSRYDDDDASGLDENERGEQEEGEGDVVGDGAERGLANLLK